MFIREKVPVFMVVWDRGILLTAWTVPLSAIDLAATDLAATERRRSTVCASGWLDVGTKGRDE